jgi:hypothetical protein
MGHKKGHEGVDPLEKFGKVAKDIVSKSKATWKKNNERIRKRNRKGNDIVKNLLLKADSVIDRFKKGYKDIPTKNKDIDYLNKK